MVHSQGQPGETDALGKTSQPQPWYPPVRAHTAQTGPQDPAKLREVAERQLQRISALAPDGLVLYDLQDEAGRTGVERPFAFLPTLEPTEYARDFLADLAIPKVFYKCVANLGRGDFQAWLAGCAPERDAYLLVGALDFARPRDGRQPHPFQSLRLAWEFPGADLFRRRDHR